MKTIYIFITVCFAFNLSAQTPSYSISFACIPSHENGFAPSEVEVISHSTRKIDEQIKRLEYMNIPTLKEYVMIEQDYVDICVLRKNQHWQP